mmetsp:Transcript_63520/g.113012  ORF Transcript_63520/g.113012 Transcript_63520/m.113012 type:complete len:111 (-) Transcript_63520:202-534(-)
MQSPCGILAPEANYKLPVLLSSVRQEQKAGWQPEENVSPKASKQDLWQRFAEVEAARRAQWNAWAKLNASDKEASEKLFCELAGKNPWTRPKESFTCCTGQSYCTCSERS